MTVIGTRYVEAENISTAWLELVRILYGTTSRKCVHLIARIESPTAEVTAIRAEADGLIAADSKLPAIDTTRNTIFPAAWARRYPEPSELAAYYRDRYNKAGLRGFPQNRDGTYFGRVVAYPRGADKPIGDQLSNVVRKLRLELSKRGPKSSRYEINIFNEALDKNPMSFPCLAHVSFHLDRKKLHLQAIYRNEYLIGRAYGNFLGLGQLQAYVASACGVGVGELLMTIGHAELERSRRGLVSGMLGRLPAS